MSFFRSTGWLPPDYPRGIPIDVCQLYEQLALLVYRRGYSRYSSDAILHHIRWSFNIERGQREFKCNDHWTAPLARWFLKRHPELSGFFELRALKEERYAQEDGFTRLSTARGDDALRERQPYFGFANGRRQDGDRPDGGLRDDH